MLTSSLPLYRFPCTIQQSVAVHQIQHMYENPVTIKSIRLLACLRSSSRWLSMQHTISHFLKIWKNGRTVTFMQHAETDPTKLPWTQLRFCPLYDECTMLNNSTHFLSGTYRQARWFLFWRKKIALGQGWPLIWWNWLHESIWTITDQQIGVQIQWQWYLSTITWKNQQHHEINSTICWTNIAKCTYWERSAKQQYLLGDDAEAAISHAVIDECPGCVPGGVASADDHVPAVRRSINRLISIPFTVQSSPISQFRTQSRKLCTT